MRCGQASVMASERVDEHIAALVERSVAAVQAAPPDHRPHLSAVVLKMLLGMRDGGEGPTPHRPTAPTSTLGEEMARLGRRSQPEQLLAIVVHRLEAQAIDVMSLEMFRDAYDELRLPRPQNISEQIGRCVRRGWLATSQTADRSRGWRVTQTGLTVAKAWAIS